MIMGTRRSLATQPWKDAGPLSGAGWLFVLLWTRLDSPWVLAAASGCAACAAVAGPRGARRIASAVLLVAAVAAGFASVAGDRRYAGGWEAYRQERHDENAALVRAGLDSLAARDGRAARRIADAAASSASRRELQDTLRLVLEATGATAAAVVGPDGQLRAWVGSHHGRVPDRALDGRSRYLGGTPLFSYLYFAAQVPGGQGTAVVASLVQSGLPRPLAADLGDFAAQIEERTGDRIELPGPRVGSDADGVDRDAVEWRLVTPTAAELRSDHKRFWDRVVVVLAALAWLLQSFGGSRHGRNPGPLLAGLLAAAALVPVEDFFTASYLASPGAFALSEALPIGLGRAGLLACAAVPLLVSFAPTWRAPLGAWTAPAAVGVGFPLVLLGFGRGASPELLGGSPGPWIVYQAVLTLILALVAGVALTCRTRARARNVRLWIATSGAVAAAAAALAMSASVRTGLEPSPWLAALWAAPAGLVAQGLAGRRRFSYSRWVCATALAGTAVLPFAWSQRTEARKSIAEAEIARLGVVRDPGLDAVLDRFGAAADSLDRVGADELEVLYRAWTGSGLASRGVPVFLTLWAPDGSAAQELKLGVEGERPADVEALLPNSVAASERRRLRPDEAGGHHLFAVPLASGRWATVIAPPRRTIALPSPSDPLLASVGAGDDSEFLTLVRRAGDAPSARASGVEWRRNDEGWRAESVVQYPDGAYSVFYVISIPNFWVMLARAVLLLVPAFGVVSALWLLSAGVPGSRLVSFLDWANLSLSFRFRVTVTLFGFFLLSAVLFWVLANNSLTGAAERTAAALAERVAGQIAEAYQEEGGSMELLARRVGADLLEYRDGELVGGSVDELFELGLYETWVDPDIHDALESGQRLAASKTINLGDWQYVVAYRRLPDGDVVASPVPVRAGAAALRRRDLADVLLATLVVSPVLSLVLAFFVGRGLTRPLQDLRVASDRVGEGNLAVGLPDNRSDEFGTVFAAFNRMVLRLDETRRELVRTTRRTKAIVEDVDTGVLAVDRTGRVTVMNPRAQALLRTPLEPGAPLPESEAHAGELARWLRDFDRKGPAGAAEEEKPPQDASPSDGEAAARVFEWSDRRIRARVRRISHEGHMGGVVVNLEDVTDELRSERILAWGEMAKQVAHEMRNPLTPMTLSMQHLQRAWKDRRGDFGRILETSVDMVLGEIDRLAAIARSFLRLASPGAVVQGPVVAVDAGQAAGEVLDLYRGEAEMHVQVVGDLPSVMARRDEFKEVLLNLIENARAAMPEGGAVRISALPAPEGQESGDVEPPEDGKHAWVLVVVEDEGTGIPPELLPRIFEPQFSTRSTGTGLGLAIVRRLVESWGGSVDAESEAGQGTRLRLRLRRG